VNLNLHHFLVHKEDSTYRWSIFLGFFFGEFLNLPTTVIAIVEIKISVYNGKNVNEVQKMNLDV